MAVIGSINILMQASTSKLTKGLADAKQKFTSFASGITTAMGPVGGAISGALAGLAIGGAVMAGIERLRSLANESFKLADDLATMATKTGLTVKALSELSHIAKRSDVDFDTLSNGLKKLNLNLVEAASTGKGATNDALKALGLSATHLANIGADKALGPIADAIAAIKNPAQQAAAAADVFGSKLGPELLPLLQQGSKGIEELRQEAHDLGAVMDDVTAAKLNAFNDAWDKLTVSATGFGTALGATVAPAMTDLAERLTAFTAETGKSDLALRDTMASLVFLASLGVDAFEPMLRIFTNFRSMLYLATAAAVKFVEPFARAYDYVQKLRGEASSLGELLNVFSGKLAGQSQKDMARTFSTSSMGTDLRSWYAGLGQSAADAGKELGKFTQEHKELETAADKIEKQAKDYIERLRVEAHTFGWTSEAIEIYKLSKAGASAEAIKAAEAWRLEIERLRANKKAIEDAAKARQKAADEAVKQQEKLADLAKQVVSETMTPQEKYNEKIRELNELWANGKLSLEQYKRAQAKAVEDNFGKKEKHDFKFANAALKGSQEARSMLLAAMGQGQKQPLDKVEQNTRMAAAEARRQTEYLKTLAQNPFGEVVVVSRGK